MAVIRKTTRRGTVDVRSNLNFKKMKKETRKSERKRKASPGFPRWWGVNGSLALIINRKMFARIQNQQQKSTRFMWNKSESRVLTALLTGFHPSLFTVRWEYRPEKEGLLIVKNSSFSSTGSSLPERVPRTVFETYFNPGDSRRWRAERKQMYANRKEIFSWIF